MGRPRRSCTPLSERRLAVELYTASSGPDNEGAVEVVWAARSAHRLLAQLLGITCPPNDVHLDGPHNSGDLGLRSARLPIVVAADRVAPSWTTNGHFMVGPVDYMIVEFPMSEVNGSGASEFVKLIESRTIRIIDLELS